MLFDLASSQAQRANLLSVSSAWLSVMPTPQLNLHLEPPEFQVPLKWWLGMDTSQNTCCAFCPSHAVDPLVHHALTCKSGGDLILRHNALRDTVLESLQAGIQLKAGSSLDEEGGQTRPADILVQNWEFGKPAALDFTVTSLLNPMERV
eukprot:Em0001g10a